MRAVKIPRLEGGSIGPRTESLLNWDGPMAMVPCLHKGNIYIGWTFGHGTVFVARKDLYQKEATGMERPEMYSVSRCNNPTNLCGPSKYPISTETV